MTSTLERQSGTKAPDAPVSKVSERRGVLHHPVLLYISSKVEIKTCPSLKSYVVKVMRGDLPIPSTLTQFYRSYFEDQLKDFFSVLSHSDAKKVDSDNVDEILDKLGKLAFDDVVKQKHVTRKVVKKMFKNVDINDVPLVTYGLLHEDDKGLKYLFKEPILQEYLMARYQFRLVLKKLQKGSTNKRDLYDSVYMIPNTADAWCVMFGMMSDNDQTVPVQKKLLAHVIRKMKKSAIVKPKDITIFCLQVVFETKNKGDVASILDLFTRNETVDLVSLALPPQKIAYYLSALGFIVETTKMYGLQIEEFQMTESSIGLLTDPANEVSDNNLQFLSLSGNPLGSHGVRRLQPFLVKASLLTWLDLSSCQLRNSGVMHFCYIIECMPLIWLNLADNEITDKGSDILASHLRLCPTMREFSLANNRITDCGADGLARAIEDLPEIMKVILIGNEIGEDGEMSLRSAALKIALEGGEDDQGQQRKVTILLDDQNKEQLITPDVTITTIASNPGSPFDDISMGSLSKLPSLQSLESLGSWEGKPDVSGTLRSLPPDIKDKTNSLGRRSIGGGSLARRRVIAQSLRRLHTPTRPRLSDSLFMDPNTSGHSATLNRASSSLSHTRENKYNTLPRAHSTSTPRSTKTQSKIDSVPNSPDTEVPRPKVDIQINGVPMITSPESSIIGDQSFSYKDTAPEVVAVESPVVKTEAGDLGAEVSVPQQQGDVSIPTVVVSTEEEFSAPDMIADGFSDSVLRTFNQESEAVASDFNDISNEVQHDVQDVQAEVSEGCKTAADEGQDLVQSVEEEGQNVAQSFEDQTKSAVQSLEEQGEDVLDSVKDKGQNLMENVQDEGENVVHSIEEDGKNVLQSAEDEGKNVVQSVEDEGKDLIRSVEDQGQNVMEYIQDEGKNVVNSVENQGENVVQSLEDQGQDFMQSLSDEQSSLKHTITEGITDVNMNGSALKDSNLEELSDGLTGSLLGK